MKKIGNTSFHEEAIKKMTLKEFRGVYKGMLKGADVDDAYKQLTGKEAKAEKEED